MTASTVAVYDAIATSYAARRAEMPPRLVQLAQRALAIVRRSGAAPIAIADLGCGAGRDLAQHLTWACKAGASEGFEPNRSETWAAPRFVARYEQDELAAALQEAGFCRVAVSPPATDERGETWLHALARAPDEPAATR